MGDKIWPLIHDDRGFEIHIGDILQNVKCSICFNIMRDPVFLKSCGHRYCRSCMQRCVSSKQCPQCREHFGTHRALVSDTRFTTILGAMFEDPGEVEKSIERDEREKMEWAMKVAARRVRAMEKLRQDHRKKRRERQAKGANSKSEKAKSARSETAVTTAASLSSSVSSDSRRERRTVVESPREIVNVVSFFLLPHPQETRLKKLAKPLVTTSLRTKVSAVAALLSKRLSSDGHFVHKVQIELCYFANGKTMKFANDKRIEDILEAFWIPSIEQYEMGSYFMLYKTAL